MTQLLDTSVLVGMERRRMAPARIVEVAPDEPSAIAAGTVAELLVGAHRADSEVRRRFRERFVREVVAAFEVLNYGLEVAETHASIWAKLLDGGNVIGAYDLVIAATTVRNSFAVVTDNAASSSGCRALMYGDPLGLSRKLLLRGKGPQVLPSWPF